MNAAAAAAPAMQVIQRLQTGEGREAADGRMDGHVASLADSSYFIQKGRVDGDKGRGAFWHYTHGQARDGKREREGALLSSSPPKSQCPCPPFHHSALARYRPLE